VGDEPGLDMATLPVARGGGGVRDRRGGVLCPERLGSGWGRRASRRCRNSWVWMGPKPSAMDVFLTFLS
jgi:hypothetical protein